jgi:hypothetical protein
MQGEDLVCGTLLFFVRLVASQVCFAMNVMVAFGALHNDLLAVIAYTHAVRDSLSATVTESLWLRMALLPRSSWPKPCYTFLARVPIDRNDSLVKQITPFSLLIFCASFLYRLICFSMLFLGASALVRTQYFAEVRAFTRRHYLQTRFLKFNAFLRTMGCVCRDRASHGVAAATENAALGNSPSVSPFGSLHFKSTHYKRVLPDPPCIDFSGDEGDA